LILFVFLFLPVCGTGPDSPGGLDPSESLPGGGTETGNPAGGEVIFLSFDSSDLASSSAALVASQAISPEARVTEALTVVREIRFEEDEDCHDLMTSGMATIFDLLDFSDGEETTETETDHFDGQENCRPTMTVTFGPLREDDFIATTPQGRSMLGLSLRIRIEGAREEPVELRSSQEWTVTFREPSEWVDPAKGENLICGFDRGSWFDGIGLSDPSYPMEEEAGESLVVVSSEQFPDILRTFIENKISSLGLYPDRNGDGELSGEEFDEAISFILSSETS
jgi:hypothetical protein